MPHEQETTSNFGTLPCLLAVLFFTISCVGSSVVTAVYLFCISCHLSFHLSGTQYLQWCGGRLRQKILNGMTKASSPVIQSSCISMAMLEQGTQTLRDLRGSIPLYKTNSVSEMIQWEIRLECTFADYTDFCPCLEESVCIFDHKLCNVWCAQIVIVSSRRRSNLFDILSWF